MMKKQYLHGVVPLLVFALFAVIILSVLMSGAKTYGMLSQRDDDSFTRRTAAQYITVKVKQTALQNEIAVESFGDSIALVLPTKYGEDLYVTRLYCYEGSLYELFSSAHSQMNPEDGEKILELAQLSAEINDDRLLAINLTDTNGETIALQLYLKAGEEGA